MGHIPVLDELFVIACFGVLVTIVLSRLRLPMVTGLLSAGMLVGPYGLKLVQDIKSIGVLAEIGVGLLLFSIGLDFSLSRLMRVMKVAAWGGLFQVGITVVGVTIIALLLHESAARGILYGCIIAMS